MADHIPKGFRALTPYLMVEDAPAFLEFLKEAFDGDVVMDHRQDGDVVHAEVKIFDTVTDDEKRTP